MHSIKFVNISSENTLRWMPQNTVKSTLVQVMASCHQATRHYLNQYWPRSMLPYGIIRPQWVKWIRQLIASMKVIHIFWHRVLFGDQSFKSGKNPVNILRHLPNESVENLPKAHKCHHSPCHERPPVFRDHIIQWSLCTSFTNIKANNYCEKRLYL